MLTFKSHIAFSHPGGTNHYERSILIAIVNVNTLNGNRRPIGGDARLDFHVSTDFEDFEPGAGELRAMVLEEPFVLNMVQIMRGHVWLSGHGRAKFIIARSFLPH